MDITPVLGERDMLEELISQLSPEREYGLPRDGGDLTYEEVVAGVRSGRFLISPGHRLPVLREATKGWPIRGTGLAERGTNGPQAAALARFRELAIDDVDWAYMKLRNGMGRGDPRYDKIYWENLLGKMGENRGGDAVAAAFKALIAAMQKPEEREFRDVAIEGDMVGR